MNKDFRRTTASMGESLGVGEIDVEKIWRARRRRAIAGRAVLTIIPIVAFIGGFFVGAEVTPITRHDTYPYATCLLAAVVTKEVRRPSYLATALITVATFVLGFLLGRASAEATETGILYGVYAQ